MHGVGPKPLVDQIGPDDFRRDAGVDLFLCEPPRRVLGQEQFSDLPLRIGECRRNRVPAIENHRPVRACVALAPDRPAAGFSPFFEGFTGSAPELGFSIAIAHGRLLSWVTN